MATVSNPTAAPEDVQRNKHPWLKFYDKGVAHAPSYPAIPLHRTLEDTAARQPYTIATHFLGAELTYRQLNEQADHFAAYLQRLGVRKGERVALLLPNCPQYVIAFYATLKIGAVLVPTNPLYVARELEHQFKDAAVETVVCLDILYPRVAEIREHTSIKRVIVTGVRDYLSPIKQNLYFVHALHEKQMVADYLPALGRVLYRRTREGQEHPLLEIPYGKAQDVYQFCAAIKQGGIPTYVDVQPDDLAVLQYTGGTTGTSKGAMLLHRNLVANTVQVHSWLSDRLPHEIFMAVMPFFHVYGLTVVMTHAVECGATMVLMPRFVPADVVETIEKLKPTVFCGVPTMYIAINNFPEIGKRKLSSIRACLSGGAALPIEVAEEFERLTGGRLVEGYGLTEASPVTHSNPIWGQRKAGSIGIPYPSTEAKVVDMVSRAEQPLGEIGELAIRGPQVMAGYWQRAEENAQVFSADGEWLYTGDMAVQDEDGYFYIRDRKKDLIIASGYNIYPREIEEVLYQMPQVKEAVVVGVPDRYRGETVKAYLVLKDGETLSEDAVISFCRASLARYKVPHLVEFRPSLPKTLIGKFLRRLLVEEDVKKQAAAE